MRRRRSCRGQAGRRLRRGRSRSRNFHGRRDWDSVEIRSSRKKVKIPTSPKIGEKWGTHQDPNDYPELRADHCSSKLTLTVARMLTSPGATEDSPASSETCTVLFLVEAFA